MKSVFVSVQPRNADFFLQGSGLRPHNISIILPLEKEPLPRRAGANAAVGGAGASIAQMYICTACWGKPQSPMPPAGGNFSAELPGCKCAKENLATLLDPICMVDGQKTGFDNIAEPGHDRRFRKVDFRQCSRKSTFSVKAEWSEKPLTTLSTIPRQSQYHF